ncbi:hypothetical protein HY522_04940 [bacterium]|nr:hypothetical protein [bacterium]
MAARLQPFRPLLRILDANFNRALEGCRVIEDALRLGREGARGRYFRVKIFRHRLSFLRSRFGIRRLLAGRRVLQDPGAFRRDVLERRYPSTHAMLAANLQRVKESLRVIEEVGRTVPDSGPLAGGAKRLRFQAYGLEESILSRGRGR